VEDHYKRRLTHSLEVAQIATTVARALELNEVATEAIALGHDLGHTPFGHAGERALNKILTGKSNKVRIRKRASTLIPIFGFDHCVQGIEVVSRIEKEYHRETGHGGLNLTFEVRDGILKHMYEREHDKDRPFSNIPAVVEFPQYEMYRDNKSSLEAQCVHFADKLAYLLGDIEDGVRSNILECQDLNDDAFFKQLQSRHKDYRGNHLELRKREQFESFRSQALTTLILDCIDNAKRNLERIGPKNVDEVLSRNQRVVFASDEVKESWTAFYERWMRNNLFKNEVVEACTFKAEQIITDLFKAYFENIELIKGTYLDHARIAYKDIHDSDEYLFNLILVRNYIAGMTDAFASDQHARLYMPLERIRF
jgi:dGTPase